MAGSVRLSWSDATVTLASVRVGWIQRGVFMSGASGEYATVGLDLAALAAAARSMGPSVRPVAPRVLRRIVARVWGLGPLQWRMPKIPSIAVDRSTALTVVEPDELGLEPSENLPETLVLISMAELGALEGRPAIVALHGLWRLLLQARGRLETTEALREDRVSVRELRRRIDRIGQTEFDEVRAVLAEEGRLPPEATDRTTYAEFAATYIDFRHLAPDRLKLVFPGIVDIASVDDVLGLDLDVACLLRETRPTGAAEVVPEARPWDQMPVVEKDNVAVTGADRFVSEGPTRGLLERAEAASAKGNLVRAAILRRRAADVESPRYTDRRRSEARTELNKLARRLRAALDLDESRSSAWRHTLHALIDSASRGLWPFEARLLYDLQKVCIDHERNVYATSLVGWVFSAGRQPIARLLPHQREVLMVKHLRSALVRLPKVRLAETDRERAFVLIHEAIDQAERRLRARFRPLLARALERSGVLAANLPERVSLEATVEELLDRLVEFGLLTMGDVRDALSRGDVKLPDLSDPMELIEGDRLLKADRQLSVSLDGVYRPGEVYLRLLQRASAVGFGTRMGRRLTRYVVLPFGGAYGSLVALQEIVGIVLESAHKLEKWPHSLAAQVDTREPEFINPTNVLVLGCFLFGLLHSADFRVLVKGLLRLLFQPARAALIDLPAWVLKQPLMREFMLSRSFSLALRYGLKPFLAGLAVVSVVRGLGDRGPSLLVAGVATAVVAAILLNTRMVREAEEMLFDDAARLWRQLVEDFLPGLFRWTMEVFNRALEQSERLLYTVDEWLRFRSGQSKATLAAKAVLGSIWAAVHYFARIYVNLMLEPTVNPIKHFPTVTVAAKLMIPLIPTISGLIVSPLRPFVGKILAVGISGLTIFFLPGIAGFLVWELKENWKLYRANRPRGLLPRVIGGHGEDMLHLLKPGFHSGTIPKIYRRLRRSVMRPATDIQRRRAHRRLAPRLHHVEESLAKLVERHGLVLLRADRAWGGRPIDIGRVRIATNRLRVELLGPQGSSPVRLAFDERSGWLVASIERVGWLTELDPSRRRAFEKALIGLYALAGVHLVREWLRVELNDQPYDVSYEGLVVWPGAGDTAVTYDLDHSPVLLPKRAGPRDVPISPALMAVAVRFDATPILWDEWVAAWDEDRSNDGPGQRSFLPRSPLPS